MTRHLLSLIILLFAGTASFASTDTLYKCVRAEVGYNRSWFAGIGASAMYQSADGISITSFTGYVSAEINFANIVSPYQQYYGCKVGFETAWTVFLFGLEGRGLTDFKGHDHAVVTPKVGLSAFGIASLCYGYNMFEDDKNTFSIYHHQFSFSANIPYTAFSDLWKRKSH